MKLYFLIFTFIFISCSSTRNLKLIKKANNDGLKNESIVRYSHQRLETLTSKNTYIQDCLTDKNHSERNFEQLIQKNKFDPLTWNLRTSCYIHKEQLTQAMYTANTALALAKTKKVKAIILNNIAIIHLKNKKYESAKEYLKKSIELNSTLLTPKYNLATLYLKFGLHNKALKILNDLSRKSGDDIDFNNSLATGYIMKAQYKRAIWFLNKIPEEYHSRDDIALNFATTYFATKKFDKALAKINNAQTKHPIHSVTLNKIKKIIDSSK